MKNLPIVLNVILLIAVAVLYVLHFSAKTQDATVEDTKVVDLNDLSIAYVNTDSVLNNYKFYEELSSKFEEKQRKAEANLKQREQGLQQELINFQNTAGNMTPNQARAVQEDLQKKDQNLRMYAQSLSQELMMEEAKISDSLYTKLTGFLKDYGKKNDLQLVLTFQRGSGVLFAADSLNITNEVVRGLNEQHLQKGKKETSDTTSVE